MGTTVMLEAGGTYLGCIALPPPASALLPPLPATCWGQRGDFTPVWMECLPSVFADLSLCEMT